MEQGVILRLLLHRRSIENVTVIQLDSSKVKNLICFGKTTYSLIWLNFTIYPSLVQEFNSLLKHSIRTSMVSEAKYLHNSLWDRLAFCVELRFLLSFGMNSLNLLFLWASLLVLMRWWQKLWVLHYLWIIGTFLGIFYNGWARWLRHYGHPGYQRSWSPKSADANTKSSHCVHQKIWNQFYLSWFASVTFLTCK